MKQPNKRYLPTRADEDEAAERQAHEEEMHRAEERLEKRRLRTKRTILCAAVGALVGLLDILWISYGASIRLPDGRSLYEAYMTLSDGSSLSYFLLDFLPPVLLSALGALFVQRGERGRVYFILTALLALFIVLAVFMCYMALSAIG